MESILRHVKCKCPSYTELSANRVGIFHPPALSLSCGSSHKAAAIRGIPPVCILDLPTPAPLTWLSLIARFELWLGHDIDALPSRCPGSLHSFIPAIEISSRRRERVETGRMTVQSPPVCVGVSVFTQEPRSKFIAGTSFLAFLWYLLL